MYEYDFIHIRVFKKFSLLIIPLSALAIYITVLFKEARNGYPRVVDISEIQLQLTFCFFVIYCRCDDIQSFFLIIVTVSDFQLS